MPIHDWTRVSSGYFHHFHQCCTSKICDVLNAGLLPKGIFALIEQSSVARMPDVSTLTRLTTSADRNGVAILTEPPKTRFVSRAAEELVYAGKANRVALHREDETIAVIEIVSPGNKSSQYAIQQFVDKSFELIERGIHLLVVDLFPPTRRDPEGIHPAIWCRINPEPFALPADKQLTLASYVAGPAKTAYVEPVAVGDSLPEMPVFLDTRSYIRVPLDKTYEATWNLCPAEFRERVTVGQL